MQLIRHFQLILPINAILLPALINRSGKCSSPSTFYCDHPGIFRVITIESIKAAGSDSDGNSIHIINSTKQKRNRYADQNNAPSDV